MTCLVGAGEGAPRVSVEREPQRHRDGDVDQHERDERVPPFAQRVVRCQALYGDEKVANRDTMVWHGATENSP